MTVPGQVRVPRSRAPSGRRTEEPIRSSVPAMRSLAPFAVVLVVWSSSACSSSPPGAGTAATVDVPPATTGAPSTATTPATAAPSATAPAPATSSPAPAASDLAGTWASASCGARTYERVLELRADGTFTASDRISPCPPGATCVWSGIIVREGAWARGGDRVTLTVTRDGKGPAGRPLPATLVLDGASLAEEVGADRCPYARR